MSTMQAVVFQGPLKVTLEQRPVPQIEEPTDVIVKWTKVYDNNSELHVFRGHQPSGTGFIMGHEFTGEIVEVGSAVRGFKVGDLVVSPFTVNCGECFYCARKCSSRCAKGKLYGSVMLDGGQADYARVPSADATLVAAPAAVDEKKLVLMADILPTGFFAARNAFKGMDRATIEESTVLLFGCGPVGLCALISALDYRPKHLIAVDSVPSRLELAKSLGAEPWNFQTDAEGLKQRVKDLTEGRGADVAIEVVGHSDALRMAFDNLRPWGRISSIGVHNGEIPWTGNEAYGKNLQIQMGRCPVRSIFEDALEFLIRKQDSLGFMVGDIRPLSQAIQAYDDFNQMKSQKIIFEAGK
ncbi:alcohol dehydrogenase [Aspergillus flavus]|nr:alcohol dehydrogenase [Aspergillus flavus]